MINYGWKCRNCNHEFDRRVESHIVATDCPKCLYGNAADRKPSAPAFSVKGGTPKFHK